jgi:sulfur carrier protein
MITVTVTGEEMQVSGGASVRALLEQRGLGDAVCAVEVNRALVPKASHEAHAVRDGDRIEIVTLVGGG